MAEKEVEVAYSRIMLLGSAGVGKTCFTRSLMEKPFLKDTDSTIVSKVHSVAPVRQSNKSNTPPDHYRPDDYSSPDCYRPGPDDYPSPYRPDDYHSPDRYRPGPDDYSSPYRQDDYPSPDRYRPGRDDYPSPYRRDDYPSPDHYRPGQDVYPSPYRRDDYPSPDHYRPGRDDYPSRYYCNYRPNDYNSQDCYRSDDYPSQDRYRPDDYDSQDRYRYGKQNNYGNPSYRPDNPDDHKEFYGGQAYEDFTPKQYMQSQSDCHPEKDRKHRPVQYSAHMLSDKRWKEVDENDEIEEVARLIAAVYENASGSEDLRTAVAALSLYKVDSSLSLSELSVREIQKKEVDSFLAKAIKRAQEIEPVPIQDVKPQPFMHIWDCGGQAVFLEILPAFLTPRTMFFLIFNAAKSLDEKWENIRNAKGIMVCDEVENVSTKNLLFNWMTNIHHHLAQLDERGAFLSYPRIYCIGTHGDQINHDKQIATIEKMKSTYKDKAFSYLIKKVLIVDNTTAGSDQNFSTIRGEVIDFTSNKLIVKTPVSWVLFRKVFKMLDKKVISLKEAHEIGLACKIPLNDVPKALLFYHDLGVLLYYPFIQGLQNKVIINPQWFVDTLGKVFTLEGRENQNATEAMWSLLREKGILVQPLYQEVWGDCKEIEADDLMELLVHFRLAAEVETDQFFIRNAKQYFLPAVLKSYDISSSQSSSDDEPVARATNLHITFSTDFVPPGFFTRFITSFAKASLCKICFEASPGVFRNRIMFKYGNPDINEVTVTDLCGTIQVSVERYIDAQNVTAFSNTCQELKKLLEKCCNEVDEALASQCNSSKKIELERRFCYECTACDKYELHFISTASGQTADLPLHCKKKKKQRRPTPEESYWFPEGEQTAQNVPVCLDEKEMVMISQRVSDKADSLAAGMNMLQSFKAHRRNHPENPMLYLLDEWTMGGGRREDLVKTLKDVNLLSLADQVQNSNYRSRNESASSTGSRQQTFDPPSGAESSPGIEGTKAIEFQVTEAIKADQSKKFAKMVLEVIKEYEKSKEPDDQAIVNQDKHETQSGDHHQEHRQQRVEPQQRQQQQIQQEVQIQQESQPQEHITSGISLDISDDDLLRSAKYLKPQHVKKFAEVYDDDSRYLHSELEKYENSDAQTKAYQVLRAMLRRNPNINRKSLQKKLSLLGFDVAAKK
uniref:COR domain-containing protein n=1 Tax=Amphimedon queenslandica TaxID=400682 RepID=A0A1X7THT0_AMPQE